MAQPNDFAPDDTAESELRYRSVVENAFDMIQSCHPDGSFEFVNKAWREKLGYTQEEVDRLIIWDVVHEESREHCQALFMAALAGESVDGVRATFVAKDGSLVPVEGNATSRIIGGKVVATHSFFRDITERLRAEDLERRNLELEHQQRLRTMEKMAALGKLSAGLAHELNNPAAAVQRAADQAAGQWSQLGELTTRLHRSGLAEAHWDRLVQAAEAHRSYNPGELSALARADREEAITDWLEAHGVEDAWSIGGDLVAAGFDQTGLETLMAGVPDAQLEDALRWLSSTLAMANLLDTIATSSSTIADLVGAVKQYSYMDRAPEQEVDVHDGLENTLLILRHKLKEGIRVERAYDRELPRITVPAGELNQVWTNLIDNAIDACGPDGVVRVSTSRDGGWLVVEVADNGSGIPPENQSRVFDPFFTTKDIGKGSGIGLEVARRIVTELCRGEISFESKPGDTRFRVALPLG